MANALTGDFEAVIEINAGTLRRLVASMHQQGFANPANPGIPHVTYLRLDDAVTGHRGSIAAQIGVPYLHLIDGATDRFQIEVGIRARYRADVGSPALAEIIHGTVRAEYRRHRIDPRCDPWGRDADEYFWFRVVKDSVTFEGDVLNESSAFSLTAMLNEPLIKAQLTAHLASILEHQFEPTPQRVSARFQRIRSISRGEGPGDAAIAIPYGLSTDTPPGALSSIQNIFLQGHDFAVAVSADSIMEKVRPLLTPLVGMTVGVHHSIDGGVGGGVEIDYKARVDTADADWLGSASTPVLPLSGGLVRIRLTGVGWCARLYRSGVFNLGSISAADLGITFVVEQFVRVSFDPGAASLHVAALGTPIVNIGGGPAAWIVSAVAKGEIEKRVTTKVTTALAGAQAQIAAMDVPGARAELVRAIRGLDTGANAYFTEAIFRPDGVVLCGAIPVTHRYRPQVSFERTPAGDGFDAIESWIPGGRVDRFEWSWRWFTTPIEQPPGPPGSASRDSTFTLRRPQGSRTKFGLATALSTPLPGLDGHGKVCLAVIGVHVDPFTGMLVPVRSEVDCEQFGFEFRLPYEVGPLVPLWDPERSPQRGVPEVGTLRVAVPEARAASNTLVLRLQERWDQDAIETLVRGLDASRARGTGLLVVLLFPEGVLSGDRDTQVRVEELRRRLPAPLLATEDLRGGWSATIALPADAEGPSWRLLNPAGAVSWAHDQRADGALVASVLDRRLESSAPPALTRIQGAVALGTRLPIELMRPDCPSIPHGAAGSTLVFVHKDSAAGREVLQSLTDDVDRDDDRPRVAVVVEGADASQVETLRRELNLRVPFFPDPGGTLTRRAGVRLSPATLALDGSGIVTGVQIGVADRRHGTGHAAEGE